MQTTESPIDIIREVAGQSKKPTVSNFVALRDHFAGQAMAAQVLALSTSQAFANATISEASDCELVIEDYIAARAYDWADAMLKARS